MVSECVPPRQRGLRVSAALGSDAACTHLSGVEVDEAVASRLALQRPRLVEQEVKLLHVAELLQQLHQMVPARRREQA